MKIGRNQPKPRGFNYRPFYHDEREEEREKLFGHLHKSDNNKRINLKGSFKKPDNKIQFFNPKMIRTIVLLCLTILAFIFIWYSKIKIPTSVLDFLQ